MAKTAKPASTDQALGVWLHGWSGRMGQELQTTLGEAKHGFRLFGGSSEEFHSTDSLSGRPVTKELLATFLENEAVRLVLDFTSEAGNALLLAALKESNATKKAVLIGTTGLSDEVQKKWRAVAAERQLAVLFAPNTSIGVLLTALTAQAAASALSPLGYDIEIVETHHKHKKDAPSGTARFLAQAVTATVAKLSPVFGRSGAREANQIGMHAVRGGGVFGEHEVRLIGEADEITISHRAFSRALFATGALVLGRWLVTQMPGSYGLLDINIKDLISVNGDK